MRRASSRGSSKHSSGAHPLTSFGARSTTYAAKFANISLDLIYGIPGQSPIDLDRDIDQALALAPSTCRGTSWRRSRNAVHARPRRRARRQAEEMEDYFERVER